MSGNAKLETATSPFRLTSSHFNLPDPTICAQPSLSETATTTTDTFQAPDSLRASSDATPDVWCDSHSLYKYACTSVRCVAVEGGRSGQHEDDVDDDGVGVLLEIVYYIRTCEHTR